MRGRAGALGRALIALALTGALVFGVPILLVVLVGNPLPASMPTVGEIQILLTQNGQGFANFIIGTLAVLIWAMWAQLVLALAVEVAAIRRQGETRQLATLPGVQALAARLIAAIVLATTLAATPLLAPTVGALDLGELAPLEVAHSLDASRTTIDLRVGPQMRAVAEGTPDLVLLADEPGPSLLVSDYTELWDLADSAYGDGVSWKLIAQANAGLSDAGGVLITSDTQSVSPGTELRLPGAIDSASIASFGTLQQAQTRSAPAVHVVQSGESMWSVAEQVVENKLERDASVAEVASYWSGVVHANDVMPSGDPDLIYPGDELILPPSTASDDTASNDTDLNDTALNDAASNGTASTVVGELPAVEDLTGSESDKESEEAEPAFDVVDGPGDNRNALPLTGRDVAVRSVDAPPSTEIDSDLGSPEAIQPGNTSESASDDDQGAAPVAALGLAGLGMALLSTGVVGALRRRRDLQRRTRPESFLAPQLSVESAALQTALTQSSHEVRESQLGGGWRLMPASVVQAARDVGPMQVHADGSGRLHAIAISSTDPATSHQVDLDPATGRVDAEEAVLPASLLVGTEVGTNEAVLFDLESTGSLEVVGDERSICRFVRTAVLDLAVSDRADDICVIGVGIAHELESLERVQPTDSFMSALDLAKQSGHTSPDSMTPVVVLSASAPPRSDASVAMLQQLGVLIVAPDIASTAQIEIHGDTATLLPSGTTVELVAFDDGDYRSVAELVDTTSASALELAGESIVVEDVVDVIPTGRCQIIAGPIEVGVLGSVEVAGAQPFSSLKAVDVIAFLAFHRNGADADQIKTWVWPPYSPPTDKAFANVLSRARTGLGIDDEGVPFLSRAGSDRTYRLSAAVTTDFDRFRAIVEHAEAATDQAETVAVLKQALELIRGVPFTGGGATSFVWADNHVRAQVEFTIDETVHRCADLALETGDLEAARCAALKGLELVPGCEQCFRRRFLVAGAGNNRSELRRAMADLERAAAVELGEPEAVDLISGELLELYHQVDQALVAGPS